MDKIKSIIKKHYGIDCINITKQIGGWSALAYKVTDEVNEYFLKIYEKSRASTPKLTALIDQYIPITIWLNDNTDLSGKIPVPLLTKDGKIKCEDDEGIYLLYEYIDGRTIGNNELSEKQICQLSEIISILHCYNDEIPINMEAIKEDFDLPFLSQFRGILSKKSNSLPNDVKELIEIHMKSIEYLIATVEKLSTSLKLDNPRMVLCHTDIHNWNLMQTSQELILIDWEGLKLAPPEADLMFLTDKPYYSLLIDIYCQSHEKFEINQKSLKFYKSRRKLEDIWEWLEQILFDNQDEYSRIESFDYLKRELEDIGINQLSTI